MNRLLSLILALFATSALAVDIPVRNPSSGGQIKLNSQFGGLAQPYVYATATTTTFGTAASQVTYVEVVDTGSNFASNAFTAPVAGRYLFITSINIRSIVSGTPTYFSCAIRKNGSTYRVRNPFVMHGNTALVPNDFASASTIIEAAVGDVFTVWCSVSAGSANIDDTEFSMLEIAKLN